MQGREDKRNNGVGKGLAYALLAVILWSGNFIVARALHHSISPVSLAFSRWLVATTILFPLAFQKLQQERKFLFPHVGYLSLTALMGVTIFNTLIYVAGKYTSATNMALIGTTAAPVFVLLISGLLLKQKISIHQYLGALLCIAGILLLLSKGNLELLRRFRFTAGDWWILAAALAFAIYTLLVRRKPVELSSTTFLFAVFFLGTLFLLPAFLIDRQSSPPIEWSGPLLAVFLYLGLGASVIAFLSWNLSIRHLGPARTALFGNLIPVFSSLEAAWLLQERFTATTFLSFAIVLLGIALANFTLLRSLFTPSKYKRSR